MIFNYNNLIIIFIKDIIGNKYFLIIIKFIWVIFIRLDTF